MEIALALCAILISLLLLKIYRAKRISIVFCLFYLMAIIYLAFISREPAPYLRYSVKLFGAARRGLNFGGGVLSGLLHGDVKVASWMSIKGIILNILLFVPFGYLLPSLFPRFRWWQVIIIGFCGSLMIEVLQLITRLGYADVDDLINNTLGAAIGVLLYKAILKKTVDRS